MRTSRGWWPLTGLLVGFAGLATSYALAELVRVRDSPLVAVAESVIELTPGKLAHWAIETFGHHDKTVLVVGTLVLLTGAFALLGRAGRARSWVALAGYLVLGAIGAVAVLTRPQPSVLELVPVVAGLLVWLGGWSALEARLRVWEREPADGDDGRRGFLRTMGVVGLAIPVLGLVGRFAGGSRRRAEESRRALRIAASRPAVPAGAELGVRGLQPWQTPADDFYLIDTAIVKPAIDAATWELRIHGMVERELTLTLDDLLARELTEDWITLNCVSNPVGGDLIGNAWWSGVRLAPLLAEAGIREGADACLQTSDDGWTCGTPLAALTDDRNAILAVAMNGEPLPIEHGFPVRTIVPGLYGYVSATKWVVDLEVTRFDRISAYWTDRGWAAKGPVKIASTIEVPGDGDRVAAGKVVVAGTAWDQHTGIARVEVSVDGGAWQPAVLGKVPSIDTWVQWRVEVDVGAGEHELRVRAVDSSGEPQTGAVADVVPDGATGWHTIRIEARA